MVAKIGPAQGDQIIPKNNPVKRPDKNPDPVFCIPNLLLNLLTQPSKIADSWGITNVKPKIVRINTAKSLSESGSKGIIFKIYARARVKKAKLIQTPKVIPRGFFLPPVADADRTIGRSGQIQGAAIVTRPEIKAKISKMSILFFDPPVGGEKLP